MNTQYLAITIHNNSIGRISFHNTWVNAVLELKARAEIQMQRELTPEELSLLKNGSFHVENDADNHTWEIRTIGEGIIEENTRKIGKIGENKIQPDFNIEVFFRDISEGVTFKSEFGSIYTKTGPQKASSGGDNGYAFNEWERIFITADQNKHLRKKEYIFANGDKPFRLSCHAYTLDSAIKNHDLGPGWYLFSIDGERV